MFPVFSKIYTEHYTETPYLQTFNFFFNMQNLIISHFNHAPVSMEDLIQRLNISPNFVLRGLINRKNRLPCGGVQTCLLGRMRFSLRGAAWYCLCTPTFSSSELSLLDSESGCRLSKSANWSK